MPTLALYKIATIVLLIITGGTTSATAVYFQQQNTKLDAKVSTLTTDLNNTQRELISMSDQVTQVQIVNSGLLTANTQLNTELTSQSNQISQLQDKLTTLQSNLDTLNHTQHQPNTTTISQGSISLSGYGAAQYVPFTVQSNLLYANLNVSFSVSGLYSIRAVLLTQAQYSTLLTCNCIGYGNYTSTTWLSPTAQTYTTTVAIPFAGAWNLAFIEPPGTGSGVTITETLKLTTQSSTGQITQTVSSGSLTVAFNGISYISFTVTTLPAVLNITYQIGGFNPYYPQSIALYLLDPTQHTLFEAGNYTSSTWSYPYSTSISTTQITLPSSGTWYIAFQEQDPNGGFAATANYSVELTTLT